MRDRRTPFAGIDDRKDEVMSTEQKVLTKKQISGVLQVSERTIDLWRERYGLPCMKIGLVCRFDREKVLAWFAQFQGEKEAG